MKRNFKIKLRAFAAALSALFALSCSDISEDSGEKLIAKASEGKALISVSANTASNSRTALPDFETSDFSYVLTGTLSGEEKSIATWATFSAMDADAVEIDVGDWSFTLTATSGEAVYESTISKTISAGMENELEFKGDNALKLKTLDSSGTGSIEVKITYPASEAKVVEATLKQGDSIVSAVTSSSNSSSHTDSTGSYVDYTASYGNVTGGEYKIYFTFYEDSAKSVVLGTFSETVLVSKGKTSKSEISTSLNASYTITYKYNSLEDGEVDEILDCMPTSFSRFSTVTLPSPTKSGYTFAGWYENSAPLLTASATNAKTGFAKEIGNREYYAKFIPNFETLSINHVKIDGSKKVGEVLTAIPYTSSDESENTKFTGKITTYAWSVSADGNSWNSVGTNSETYTPAQADYDKYIKVELTRAYTVSGTEVSANSTAIPSVTTVTDSDKVTKGTLSTNWSVIGLAYDDTPAIGTTLDATKLTAESGLTGEASAVKSTTVKNANNDAVSVEVTLGFASDEKAPAVIGTVDIYLTATGYQDAKIENAVAINVKAVAPSSNEVNGLLVTEGDNTEENPYTITKDWIRFSAGQFDGHDIEYYVSTENSVPTDAVWITPTTVDDIDISGGKKLFVRVKAYAGVAASDSTLVSVGDDKIGKLVRVTSLVLSSSLINDAGSVYMFNQTITASPKASDGTEVTASSITYSWYKGTETDGQIAWVETAFYSESNSYKITDTALIGNYIRVKATQTISIGGASKVFTTDYVATESAVVKGELEPTSVSLVYNDGTAVVVGSNLNTGLISVSDNSSATAANVVAVDKNLTVDGAKVAVPVSFVFGKYDSEENKTTYVQVPDEGGEIGIIASADGYEDLALTATIKVKAATPTVDDLKLWLVKGADNLTSVTQGYVSWTQEAVDSRVQYSTDGAAWTTVVKGEFASITASAFYLKIGAKTDADNVVVVQASDTTVNFKTAIFCDTYLGTRHLEITSVKFDHMEIDVQKTGSNVLTATVNSTDTETETKITSWYIASAVDDENIASTIGKVSTSDDEKTSTFTFNSTEVTPGTYNVTVTATRSNSSDSSLTPVTLTSTGSITIGMSGE